MFFVFVVFWFFDLDVGIIVGAWWAAGLSSVFAMDGAYTFCWLLR